MEILLKNVAAGVIGLDAEGRVTRSTTPPPRCCSSKREDVLGRDARVLLPEAEYQRTGRSGGRGPPRPARGTVEKPLHLVLPDQTLYLLVKTTVLKDEAGLDLGVVHGLRRPDRAGAGPAPGGLAGGGPRASPTK